MDHLDPHGDFGPPETKDQGVAHDDQGVFRGAVGARVVGSWYGSTVSCAWSQYDFTIFLRRDQ